jgi:hypothetical protein
MPGRPDPFFLRDDVRLVLFITGVAIAFGAAIAVILAFAAGQL